MPFPVLFIAAVVVSCIYYSVVILNDPVLKNEILGILRKLKLRV
jgi:hypothetical protein